MPKIPGVREPFVQIYKPRRDVFCGPDTPNLRAGEHYDDWVPNDHTLVKGPDGRWHGFGIIDPATPVVHEGEYCSFHISGPERIAPGQTMADWEEHEKVLPPRERPGEPTWLWAPYVVEHEGLYHMFYGPGDMRRATSTDLFRWTPMGTIFSQEGVPRDPCVQRIGGRYCMVYVAEDSIWLRWSDDLVHWSDTPAEIFRNPRKGSPESPFLVEMDGVFNLFWCIYDGTRGPYDNRTFVVQSDDLMHFDMGGLVAEFHAHAPEIVREGDGRWFVTSAEWPVRGLSIAEMVWE